MANYCVNTNAQATGEHEVHNVDTCSHLPDLSNRKALGNFSRCQDAVIEAKKTYSNSDGCKHCSPDCHTK